MLKIARTCCSSFGLRHSFVIRASSFVIFQGVNGCLPSSLPPGRSAKPPCALPCPSCARGDPHWMRPWQAPRPSKTIRRSTATPNGISKGRRKKGDRSQEPEDRRVKGDRRRLQEVRRQETEGRRRSNHGSSPNLSLLTPVS